MCVPMPGAAVVEQEAEPELTVAVHHVVPPVAKVTVPLALEASPDAASVTWLPWAGRSGWPTP